MISQRGKDNIFFRTPRENLSRMYLYAQSSFFTVCKLKWVQFATPHGEHVSCNKLNKLINTKTFPWKSKYL